MASPGTVLAFTPSQHTHLVPYIAAIHASCITHDRTMATFLPPLSHEKLLTWWKERIAEINDGTRLMYILVSDLGEDGRPRGTEVMGVVMLAFPFSETAQFRATVEMLLVHKNFRRKGVAKALMSVLEQGALQRGKTTLCVEAEAESAAEELYNQLGYVELGKIPKYGLNPAGEVKGMTFFFKQLE